MKPYFRLLRPQQWSKNLLVFAALLFAQRYFYIEDWVCSVSIFIAFSLVASGNYIINDLLDVQLDRLHPRKSKRPIAAGEIGFGSAISLAVCLFIVGLLIGWSLNLLTFAILLGYVIIMLLYSIRLKQVMLLDVFIIALGLTSRAIIGGTAIEVSISSWLQVCTFFVALMFAMAKRRQELSRVGEELEKGRKSLRGAPPLLVWDLWIIMVSAITILSYTLYTTDAKTIEHVGSNGLLYSVPFVVFAILRYQVAVYVNDKGEDPTETLLRDRWILLSVLGWILTVIIVLTHILDPYR